LVEGIGAAVVDTPFDETLVTDVHGLFFSAQIMEPVLIFDADEESFVSRS